MKHRNKRAYISDHALERFIERVAVKRQDAIYAEIRRTIKKPLKEYDSWTKKGPRKLIQGKFNNRYFWLVVSIDKKIVYTILEDFKPDASSREVGLWYAE